jgi:polysaccharide export outer membrane protein
MGARLSLATLLMVVVCSTGALAQSAPAPSSAVVPDTVIRPGDQVAIKVFGEQSLSQTLTVAADGKIDYPLIGPIALAGLTPPVAQKKLSEALQRYVRNPLVTLSIVAPGSMSVSVVGNVKSPGVYQIRSGGRLSDALAAAGGFGPTNGDLPDARITFPDGSTTEVSLQKLLHDGDSSLNVALTDKSVVNIAAPNLFTVQVVGAVDRPGNVQLEEGQRLSMAIARAGTSPNAVSDLNHVVITRTEPDGKTVKLQVNMYNALLHGDMSADPVLQKGDLVYVPQGTRPVSMGGVTPLSLIQNLTGNVVQGKLNYP